MGAPPRTRHTPDHRRAALIASAADLFACTPFDQVRLDEVATRAGCSRALLYHYFPNKRALFLAVVRDVMSEISRTRPTDLAGEDQLRTSLREYFRWAHRNAGRYQVAVHAASTDAEVRAIWASSRKATADQILTALPPHLRARRSTRLMVTSWISFTITTCLEWLDNPRGVSASRLADICVTTFVSALKATSTVKASSPSSRQ